MTRRALIVGILGVCLLAGGGQVTNWLTEALGGGTPSGYTALAVVDPQAVADGVTPGESITVSVANGHGSKQRYHWRLEHNGTVRAKGEIEVDAGAQANIDLPAVGLGDVAFRLDEVEHSLQWSVGS